MFSTTSLFYVCSRVLRFEYATVFSKGVYKWTYYFYHIAGKYIRYALQKNLIYVFTETKLCGLPLPYTYFLVFLSDLYIPTIGPSILLQPNRRTDRGNIKIALRHLNVGIWNAAAQFHIWEYLFPTFGTVFCSVWAIHVP